MNDMGWSSALREAVSFHPDLKDALLGAADHFDRMEAEIEKLQKALRRYGDKSRMGTVHPESLQQAIDRAFGDTSTEI